MHEAFDVVFVDRTGYLNLCADMNKAMFAWVRHEAKLAVALMENVAVDSFEMLFMTPVLFQRKFDHTFQWVYTTHEIL